MAAAPEEVPTTAIDRVEAHYEPLTPRREHRRLSRGDFGPAVDTGNVFPRNSTYNTLVQLLENVDTLPYCTGEGGGANAATIPAELATAVATVPADQRCLASVRFFSNRLLAQQKQTDRRRVRLPRYGQPEQEWDTEYVRMTPLERARKHLDKARQMYVSGRSILADGIEGPAVPQTASKIRRGRALQYNVRDDNPQLPRPNSHSALYNLWMAYKYIRDYEMNPPPPLIHGGGGNEMEVNPQRVQYDETYNFIMGSMRLEPNRLGIGAEARRIWRARGVLDPNYYGGEQEDGQDNNYAALYANVPSDARRGPERVLALMAWLTAHPTTTDVAQWPVSDQLANEGFANRAEWTDAARALKNVHDHFVPPRVILMNAEEANSNNTNPTQSAPALRYAPYASIDAPYESADAWPFPGVIEYNNSALPVFFPTGESMQPGGVGPPYRFLAAEAAEPALGPPDPRSRPERWDARQAAEILASHVGRLHQLGSSHALMERKIQSDVRGSEDPSYEPPDNVPLQYWDRGKPVFDFIRVPGGGVLPTPGSLGVDRHMYVRQLLPTLQRRVATVAEAHGGHFDTLYPLGVAPLDVPTPTDYSRLPPQRDAQIRMLMHALFLLNAPLNAWMRANLPERLWTHEPPLSSRDAGSLTFGHSWPGEGYYRRTNQNMPDPAHRGWRGYMNVFQMAPEGGIRGRSFFVPEPGNAPHATTLERPADFLTNGVPMGPFQLDPLFGRAPDHIPGTAYDFTTGPFYWVIRTNQITVMNENTWGLDWY